MNPIQRFKAWRDRRFRERVLKVLNDEMTTRSKPEKIIFDRDASATWRYYNGRIAMIDTDEVYGVPI